jgi:hypothetical protein
MATGLNEFLKHIRSNPQSDVLIDRFTSLVLELEAKARQPYFEKLLSILETSNPHGALRAAYLNLQTVRAEGAGMVLEITALQWIEQAFLKLGKNAPASLVREELVRLKKQLPAPLADRRRRKPATEVTAEPAEEKSAAEQRFTSQRADFITNLYESSAQQLLEALQIQLSTFQGRPQTDAAAAHIIQAFQLVYIEMKSTLRNVMAVFGHNPLLIDDKDQFRAELIVVFLKSPLFLRNKDGIAPQRARLIASLLTAWYDQQQHMPEGISSPEQDRLQTKLLEIGIGAILRFED